METKTRGTVSVSKRALMQLVWYITKKCDGVSAVTDVSKKKKISSIIFRKDEPEGVNITKNKNGIFVDVCVILKFGADSQVIRNTIAEEVKKLTAEIGIKINEVNVSIEGVEEN